MPHRQGIPPAWRSKSEKYRLVGSKCIKCGSVYFPQKEFCNDCGVITAGFAFSGKGTIESYTTIRTPPAGFAGPYVVAIIKLKEGPKITANVVGEEVDIGDKVSFVLRRLNDTTEGVIHYGPKFKKGSDPPASR